MLELPLNSARRHLSAACARSAVHIMAGADFGQIGAVIATSAWRDEAISIRRSATGTRLLRYRSQWRSPEVGSGAVAV